MLNQTLHFVWQCPVGGYEWREGRLIDENWNVASKSQQFLVPRARDWRYAYFQSRGGYCPISKPSDWHEQAIRETATGTGLFLNLSHLGTSSVEQQKQLSANAPLSLVSQRDVLKFANRHGGLGEPRWAVPTKSTNRRLLAAIEKLPPITPGNSNHMYPEKPDQALTRAGAFCGELLHVWQEHVAFLRFCTDLWEACKEKDEAFLNSWISVDKVRRASSSNAGYRVRFTQPPNLSPFMASWERLLDVNGFVYDRGADPLNIHEVARVGVANQIEYRLSGQLSTCAVFDAELRRKIIRLQPRSLAAALWAQFAIAFNEDKDFVRCANCGDALELTPDIARTNRRTCSRRCRVAFHRQRQKRAVQMRKDGSTLRQIAKEIDSDMATVKKWVSSK